MLGSSGGGVVLGAYLPVKLEQSHLVLSLVTESFHRRQPDKSHTISSLHIGQTILELAAAAAWAVPCSSRATRAVMSSFSVDIGVLEVWELSDMELFEGDKAPDGRRSGLFGTGGARFLPLPSTRPPPRLLREAILSRLLDRGHAAEEFGGRVLSKSRGKLAGCFQVKGRPWAQAVVQYGTTHATSSSMDLRLASIGPPCARAPMTLLHMPNPCRLHALSPHE